MCDLILPAALLLAVAGLVWLACRSVDRAIDRAFGMPEDKFIQGPWGN